MKKYITRTLAAAVVAFPLSATFTSVAKAEDNGLIEYLNQRTQQQIQQYKAQQRPGVNFGTRG